MPSQKGKVIQGKNSPEAQALTSWHRSCLVNARALVFKSPGTIGWKWQNGVANHGKKPRLIEADAPEEMDLQESGLPTSYLLMCRMEGCKGNQPLWEVQLWLPSTMQADGQCVTVQLCLL